MANEIQATATAIVSKGGVAESLSGSGVVTMAGANVQKRTLTVLISATAIDLTGITGTPPVLVLKNLDAANFVQVDSSNAFDKFPQKVRAGCAVLLYPQTATIYAKADTGSVQVQYLVCEP